MNTRARLSLLLRRSCAAAAACLALAGSAQPVIYDATADFTVNVPNPNGVWAYGYTTSLSTALTPFAEYVSDANAFVWRTNLSLGAPGIYKVTATFPVNSVAPGQLALHPGPGGEYAVLAFTAPAAGQYALNAQFFPGDSGATDATIVLNGNTATPAFYFPSTDVNPVATGNFALALGDQVRFAVGFAGSFISDSTPLTATLTFSPVPEPGTLALLGLGGIIVVLACRRHR
jgi:hypothetical protein